MFSCAFRCVKWGSGGMDGRCMEVKGQPQVWVHLETGFLSFGFLGDFPNSTSQLLSRALDVVLWHSLHIYTGSENSHSDAYASAARTFPTEPPPRLGMQTGNTELCLTTLSQSLFQKEERQDQPHYEMRGGPTMAASPIDNVSTVHTA